MVYPISSILLALAVIMSAPVNAVDISEGSRPADSQVMVRQVTSLPSTFDPLKQTQPEDAPWLQDLYEGLTRVDPQGNLIPGVAVSWGSNDNRNWIFTLRKNARWSDGTPVTAADFVYGWQQLANADTASRYKTYLQQSGVKNAQQVIRGELPPQALGITAIDSTHLKITLARPLAYFPVMTAHPAFYPQKHRNQSGHWGDNGQAQLFNGAWMLSGHRQPHSIDLNPNPYYYNAAGTVLTKVTYIEIKSNPELFRRYALGNVHISAPLKLHQPVNEPFKNQIMSSPRLANWLLVFDQVNGPTTDVRVRKALSWSIDRKAIVASVLQNRAIAAWQMTPASTGNFTPQLLSAEQHTVQERITQAKSLLLSAGYGPSRPLSLTFSYRDAGDEPQVVHAIAAMWQKQLHAQIILKPLLPGQRPDPVADVTGATVLAEFNHPAAFLNPLTSGHPQNISEFSNKQYDSLIHRAEQESSDQFRNHDYNQAEHLIAEQVPVAPVFQYVTQRLVAPGLQGYQEKNPQGLYYSRELWPGLPVE